MIGGDAICVLHPTAASRQGELAKPRQLVLTPASTDKIPQTCNPALVLQIYPYMAHAAARQHASTITHVAKQMSQLCTLWAFSLQISKSRKQYIQHQSSLSKGRVQAQRGSGAAATQVNTHSLPGPCTNNVSCNCLWVLHFDRWQPTAGGAGQRQVLHTYRHIKAPVLQKAQGRTQRIGIFRSLRQKRTLGSCMAHSTYTWQACQEPSNFSKPMRTRRNGLYVWL